MDAPLAAVTDPALGELDERLRSLVVRRIEALHERLVQAVQARIGETVTVAEGTEGAGDPTVRKWTGRLLTVNGKRLVILPADHAAVTVPWVAVAAEVYREWVARHAAPAEEHFDLGARAFHGGRRDEAIRELEKARCSADATAVELRADAGALLERLGVELEEKVAAQRAAEAEAARQRIVVAPSRLDITTLDRGGCGSAGVLARTMRARCPRTQAIAAVRVVPRPSLQRCGIELGARVASINLDEREMIDGREYARGR